MPAVVKIEKLVEDLRIPQYGHYGDAGLDIFSGEDKTLAPDEMYGFPAGFRIEIPEGYVGLIWDKSSRVFKDGLRALAGVIDASFRGEPKIVVHNTSQKPVIIKKGEKLVQLLIQPVEQVSVQVVPKVSESPRGEGAFGSTGKE